MSLKETSINLRIDSNKTLRDLLSLAEGRNDYTAASHWWAKKFLTPQMFAGTQEGFRKKSWLKLSRRTGVYGNLERCRCLRMPLCRKISTRFKAKMLSQNFQQCKLLNNCVDIKFGRTTRVWKASLDIYKCAYVFLV
jgi:hypothetical protein